MKPKCLVCGEVIKPRLKEKIKAMPNCVKVHGVCPKCKAKFVWIEKYTVEILDLKIED